MTVVSINDPLNAPSRGSPQQAMAYARQHGATGPYADYIAEIYRLAPVVALDALLVVSQAIEETAFFTSAWWVNRGNPAGIGITGDPTQDAASATFTSGAQAAHAHLAHLLLYTTGAIGRGGLLPADDPRFSAYIQAHGHTAIAAKLSDLSGQWATDPSYAVNIAAHANAILTMPVTNPAPAPGKDTPVTRPEGVIGCWWPGNGRA